MNKFLLSITCLLVCGTSFAQNTTKTGEKKADLSLPILAQTQDFEKYIIKQKDWKETSDTQWEVHLTAKKGSLQYVGAKHLDNPNDPQFADIKSRWDGFKPTFAFYEGQDRGIADNDTLTIQKFGESGYVRYLAKQLGIPTKSLEPPIPDLYNYLVSKHSQQLVDMYMLSKEAMRLRTRKGLNKDEVVAELTKMLSVVAKMLGKEISITSISQLAAVFEQTFGKETAWWEAPTSWFDPRDTDDRVTNQLAVLSTEYRNVYMVKAISESINKGEKVFAVVGRNHVPLQVAAIRYAIGL